MVERPCGLNERIDPATPELLRPDVAVRAISEALVLWRNVVQAGTRTNVDAILYNLVVIGEARAHFDRKIDSAGAEHGARRGCPPPQRVRRVYTACRASSSGPGRLGEKTFVSDIPGATLRVCVCVGASALPRSVTLKEGVGAEGDQ